jgi:hypothetical protein
VLSLPPPHHHSYTAGENDILRLNMVAVVLARSNK